LKEYGKDYYITNCICTNSRIWLEI
jgi:hypothetical protein